jgi:hypothetical protein
MNTKQRFFHKYPRITIFLALLFLFLLCDVTAKNIIKFKGKRFISQYNHEKEYRIPSTVYHHDLKPNVIIPETSWGNVIYSVKTNSLGFKDSEPREIPLLTKDYRILLLGDSFTEGVGLDYEKTFAGMLEKKFISKGIDVLNAGVVSYSPSIYYAKAKYLLETRGLKTDEIVVFLDISDIPDDGMQYKLVGDKVVDNTAQQRENKKYEEQYKRMKKQKRPLYEKIEQIFKRDSIVTYYALKSIHDLFWERELEYDYDAINYRGALWTCDTDLFRQFGEKGLAECKKNLNHLLDLCRKHDIYLTLVVYPWPDQIVRNDLYSVQVRYWEDWTKENGIQFINLFPVFIPSPYNEHNVRKTLDTYFLHGDLHWNEAGHRLVAETFSEQFRIRYRENIKLKRQPSSGPSNIVNKIDEH